MASGSWVYQAGEYWIRITAQAEGIAQMKLSMAYNNKRALKTLALSGGWFCQT